MYRTARRTSAKQKTSSDEAKPEFPMRLNRYLALRGIATRRQADELIAAGLVTLDGVVATIGTKVMNANQEVTLAPDVKTLHQNLVYYAYHKPRGIITHSPQGKEQAIREVVGLKGVFPVGRLDKDSEGLIILTNDGRVTERLLSPRFEHEKEYIVTVREIIPPEVKERLEAGVEEGGEQLRAKQVTILNKHTANIILTEGKKHEIRRMLGSCHLTVTELRRVRIMGVHLGSLRPGAYRTLAGKAKENFLRDLGLIS